MKYLLLDANMLAGYYAPETLNRQAADAGPRIKTIIDSVRKGCTTDLRLLVPEICVAEAQTVLSKHANPKWKGKRAGKRSDPQSIDMRKYRRIAKNMAEDLHGARLIESIPIQRYHVLAKHLITPVDHHTRIPNAAGTDHTKAIGGTDELICGMAIWLNRFLGGDRLLVVTADYRMAKVLSKARKLTKKQIEDWGIRKKAEESIGFAWDPGIYPQALYLPSATEKELREHFGSWPLPTRKAKPKKADRPFTKREIGVLLDLYRGIGIARDRLPYTEAMTSLTRQFNDATGRACDKEAVWTLMMEQAKQGGWRLSPPARQSRAR